MDVGEFRPVADMTRCAKVATLCGGIGGHDSLLANGSALPMDCGYISASDILQIRIPDVLVGHRAACSDLSEGANSAGIGLGASEMAGPGSEATKGRLAPRRRDFMETDRRTRSTPARHTYRRSPLD
jgi:hypothetical protein